MLDALREMLAAPADVPVGAAREDVEVTLDSLAATTAAMSADFPFIEYGGRIVAVAGRTRCYVAAGDLDEATL